jgi:hypothetical protein
MTKTSTTEDKKKACDEALLAMLGSEEMVNKWWKSPNAYFGLETPYSIWRQRPQTVANYILIQLQR